MGRSTLDLDLLTTRRDVLEPSFWRPLESGDIAVEVRRGDPDDPLAGAVRFRGSEVEPVDLIVGRFDWQTEIVERARRLPLIDGGVPVADAADLILLKLYAGGSQDAWDIEQLLAAGDVERLRARVCEGIDRLPPEAGELWRRIAGGRGH